MGEANTSCCCTCFLWMMAILSAGLFGGSFHTLTPLEAGLKINTITAKIEEGRVFTAGRYFVGLGNSFLVYPTTLQTVDFSLSPGSDTGPLRAATSEGQTVILELSFQFRLMIGKLDQLYRKYAFGYKTIYLSVAETAMKNIVSQKYKTTDYFTDRRAIGEVMHAAVNSALKPEFAVVEHFQLRAIKPAEATERQILSKIIAQQQVVTTSVLQNSTLVRSLTTVINSLATQQVNIVVATAQSKARITVATAQATAIEIGVNASANAYKTLKDEMGFTSKELLQYLFYENIRNLQSPSKLVVDVKNALFDLR